MKTFKLYTFLLIIIAFLSVSCDPENVLPNDKDGATGYGKESVYDYIWNAKTEQLIELKSNRIVTKSKNVIVTDTGFVIIAEGYYHIKGNLDNGQLLIDADKADVFIKLSSVSISNNYTAPFYVKNARKVVVFLADNTTNTFTDAKTYKYTGEPNACMFSNDYLAFTGNGSLIVNAKFNDGISSDDALVFNSGKFFVNAFDDGLRGKNFLLVNNAELNVDVQTGHAVKSDQLTRGDRGFVKIKNGRFDLSSEEADGINSSKRIIIENGFFEISAPESQAIRSDSLIHIVGSEINISSSNEGIKAPFITIDGGKISVNAYVDAIQATYGKGNEENENCLLTINGGDIYLSAQSGRALMSNGSTEMNGGTVLVHGAQLNTVLGLDYKNIFNINGGTLIASGSSSSKFKGLSAGSKQISVSCKTATAVNSLFSIVDAAGNVVFSFKPERQYHSIIFSSSALKLKEQYKLYIGGTNSAKSNNGFYNGGTLSGGTLRTTFTVNTITTHIGF